MELAGSRSSTARNVTGSPRLSRTEPVDSISWPPGCSAWERGEIRDHSHDVMDCGVVFGDTVLGGLAEGWGTGVCIDLIVGGEVDDLEPREPGGPTIEG